MRGFTKLGTPVNLNRWFSLIAEGRADDSLWTERYLGELYPCLQLDLLSGKHFLAVLQNRERPKLQANEVDGCKAMMKDATAETRELKSSAANLLVVSTMARADPRNQDIERMVAKVLAGLEEWARKSNAELRSVQASIPWVRRQLEGEFLAMVSGGFSAMSSWSDLARFGFKCDGAMLQGAAGHTDRRDDFVVGELVLQDQRRWGEGLAGGAAPKP
jgi:hypothetical protein